MSALPPKADMSIVEIDVCIVPKADISLGVIHQVRRLTAWTLQTEETRPRAEDASRVPRRVDPVAECDLAEVFATGFDLPAN